MFPLIHLNRVPAQNISHANQYLRRTLHGGTGFHLRFLTFFSCERLYDASDFNSVLGLLVA